MSELNLQIGGAEQAAFRVHRFTLRERLHEPYLLSIVAGSTRPDLDLDAMILQPAAFSLNAGWAFVRDGGARSFTGVCTAAEQLSAEPLGISLYALRVVPRLGLLALRRGYRIFQHATVPAILSELLRELDVAAALHLDESAFPTLDYKVQYGETDLTFFTRLCEEAGITFALQEDERGESIVILSEAPGDAPLREGSPILFASDPSGTGEKEHITGVRLMREAHPLAVALRDFDFRNPALALAGRAGDEADLERLTKRPVAGLRIRGARLRCSGSTCIRTPSPSRLGELASPWPARSRFVRRSYRRCWSTRTSSRALSGRSPRLLRLLRLRIGAARHGMSR
jgi:type VI secretion system secreted protein VgrG